VALTQPETAPEPETAPDPAADPDRAAATEPEPVAGPGSAGKPASASDAAEPAVRGAVEPAVSGAVDPAVRGAAEPAVPGAADPRVRGAAEPGAADPPVRGAAEAAEPDPAGPERGGPGGGAPSAAPARAVVREPEAGEWRGIVLITGTDTDVGKTVVTSAIAASAQAAGLRVAVVKPGQTGTADGGPSDIDLVARLAAPHAARTLASYPDPLAPLAAARVAGLPPLELYEVVDAVRAEAAKHDLVLVEGAGGLLVPMGVRPSGDPWTFADLAVTLGVGAIVVARAGLGTLNHTMLTLEALGRRGVPAKVVLGAWPTDPELVHWANLSELVPYLVGALPDGAGAMDPGVFRRSAPGWLTPALYGVVDNWRTWADEVS
jgi:dethiobiotin synthetase